MCLCVCMCVCVAMAELNEGILETEEKLSPSLHLASAAEAGALVSI